MNIIALQNGSLEVHWKHHFVSYAVSTFSVTLFINNSLTGKEMQQTVSNLNSNSTIIVLTSAFCDILYFSVTAHNNAGSSEPGVATKFIPPYQPSFGTVSLSYNLARTTTEVVIAVTLQVIK